MWDDKRLCERIQTFNDGKDPKKERDTKSDKLRYWETEDMRKGLEWPSHETERSYNPKIESGDYRGDPCDFLGD